MGVHHVLIAAGLVIGIAVGATVFDDRLIIGVIFGAGVGLLGGTFLAALVSGEQAVGGPRRTRHERGWTLEERREDDEPSR